MTLDITPDLTSVNLMPATELEEIVQNVATILLTPKFTVPLDRSFGLDGKFIDEPINAAQARAVAEITEAVNSQEPRVRVKKVFFGGNLSGNVNLTVKIEIIESKLRGFVTF